jgi:hypothetical protein
MKKTKLKLVALLALPLTFTTTSLLAQTAPNGKTLASTLEVYVFPSQGQESGQQSKDEGECYDWAASNTGSDPFELQKQTAANSQQAEHAKSDAALQQNGAGARGALRGAAAGALIGEIVDDNASDGAGYGAAAGLMRARRKARASTQHAVQEIEKQDSAQQRSTQQQVTNFKKAFSVCLEAKKYMVKY